MYSAAMNAPTPADLDGSAPVSMGNTVSMGEPGSTGKAVTAAEPPLERLDRHGATDPSMDLVASAPASMFPHVPMAAAAQQDLGLGEYIFLPNRRAIWVINRTNGRFALYHFRDDQAKTIDRSRVVSLDQKTFPVSDTVYLLSDRNLTEVLWVCNRRTGDVQLWLPRADGAVDADKPIATKIDLMEK